jgi:hypothetical protein
VPCVWARRLNYRLNTACEADIDTLCAEECSPYLGSACGGRVLRCLTEKQDAIKSKECADEVRPSRSMILTRILSGSRRLLLCFSLSALRGLSHAALLPVCFHLCEVVLPGWQPTGNAR